MEWSTNDTKKMRLKKRLSTGANNSSSHRSNRREETKSATEMNHEKNCAQQKKERLKIMEIKFSVKNLFIYVGRCWLYLLIHIVRYLAHSYPRFAFLISMVCGCCRAGILLVSGRNAGSIAKQYVHEWQTAQKLQAKWTTDSLNFCISNKKKKCNLMQACE